MKKTNYVFGAAMAAAGLSGFVERANAASITQADFTFETSAVTGAVTGSGPTATAESGTGTAFGFHTASSTYSTPAGNGSAKSYSSNAFSAGDYYQFNVPTTGIQGVLVSFDQISSSTGPRDFSFQYSTNGTSFSTAGSYMVAFLSGTVTTSSTATSITGGTVTASTGFATGSSNSAFGVTFDLSTVTALNNASAAFFRLVDLDGTAVNGNTVAATGTDRIDNFVVSGNTAVSTPEPATLSVLGLAAAGLLGRRRRD